MMKKFMYGKLMGLFFAAALVLTFFSKTLYNINLPTVTVGRAEQGYIGHGVSGEQAQYYDAIIPAEALCRDEIGYYVYSVEKEESILGSQYVVRRISVDVLEETDELAAIVGVTEDMPVVLSGPEDLSEGMRVMYE